MTGSHTDDRFRRLVRRLDPHAQVLRTWPLTGGVSAEVTVLEVERAGGQLDKLLVRRHGPVDLAHNPDVATDEFRLLRVAQAHGVAAPTPYYVDETGTILPTPFVVIEYIEGHTDVSPADLPAYLDQLAAQLAKIHTVPASEVPFLAEHGKGFGERPGQLDDALSEGRIRDTLEAAWPLSQLTAPVLLHGDYWPGNVVWSNGQLAAVIDWEDAKAGDPLSDLGNTRLELLWSFGAEAMQQFTKRYCALTTIDVTNLPYWDLCAALRPCGKLSGWGLDADTERSMRDRHRLFITQAFAGFPLR